VAHLRQAEPARKPLPLEKLAALRARLPRWRKNSASLLRDLRNDERY
jgi:hypothetical protein